MKKQNQDDQNERIHTKLFIYKKLNKLHKEFSANIQKLHIESVKIKKINFNNNGETGDLFLNEKIIFKSRSKEKDRSYERNDERNNERKPTREYSNTREQTSIPKFKFLTNNKKHIINFTNVNNYNNYNNFFFENPNNTNTNNNANTINTANTVITANTINKEELIVNKEELVVNKEDKDSELINLYKVVNIRQQILNDSKDLFARRQIQTKSINGISSIISNRGKTDYMFKKFKGISNVSNIFNSSYSPDNKNLIGNHIERYLIKQRSNFFSMSQSIKKGKSYDYILICNVLLYHLILINPNKINYRRKV